MMTCATQSTLGLVQVRHCDDLYESHDVELQLCDVNSGVLLEKVKKKEIFRKKNISFKYISFVATLSSNPPFLKWITISAVSFYTRR